MRAAGERDGRVLGGILRAVDVHTMQRLIKVGVSTMVLIVDVLRGRGVTELSRGVILLYHDVHERDRLRFRRQLRAVRRCATPVRLADIEGPPDGRWRVAVTFDDGRRTFLETAVAELEGEQIPTTLFVPSALTGTSIPDEDDSALMTDDELRQLPALVEIGSHGRRHLRQSRLDAMQLKSELVESRLELETVLGSPVERHAYPYGDHSAAVVGEAGEVYRACYTVVPHLAPSQPSLTAGRVVVDPTDWPIEFALKIRGAYRWMGAYMEVKERQRSGGRRRTNLHELQHRKRLLNHAA